jgi:hypothetical protein
MIPKKQPAKEEPFLNTVARKLGHAAGTLTNVAQEFTENLSVLPKAVSTKVLQTAASITDPLNRRQSKSKNKKKTRPATRTRSVKGTTRKRKPAASRSPRRVKAARKKKNR